MSNKFKIQYYHKIPQTTSPYLQLLEAKKKIFGYKYQIIKNDKSNSQNHNKSVNMGSYVQPSHKHSKTQSNQKQKSKTHKNNSRKKRSHTEQAEERLHQSLFLNRDTEKIQQKEAKHQATKSLFTGEGAIDQSINPHEFLRNHKTMFENEERKLKNTTQQIQSKILLSKEKVIGTNQQNSLDKLEITEIDDLLNLIDGCVQQSNDYISYLTQKIETLKNDITTMKQQHNKILKVYMRQYQIKDSLLIQKDQQIDKLKKQLYSKSSYNPQKTFQIKKLLQIIDKITQQNNNLKSKLQELSKKDTKNYKEFIQKQKKDIYNEIHNKIDILNISIDKKNHQNHENQFVKDNKKNRYSNSNKSKFYK